MPKKMGMENFEIDPANDPAYQIIDAYLGPSKAILGTRNAIRKARGEPPFTDDINAFAEWCEAGEPEDPAMEPVLKRLIRDGYTS
jgi:hypothetical protein